MKNIIQRDDKYYQVGYPVLFPSTTPFQWKIGDIVMGHNSLFLSTHNVFNAAAPALKNVPQHLYILSDEEIKEGDWAITARKEIYQSKGNTQSHPIYGDKKIIATTDKSLTIYDETKFIKNSPTVISLPRPSNDFIEAYVEAQGKGYEKVLVNYYQNQRWYAERDIGYRCSNCNYVVGKIIYPRNIKCKCDFELKVAPDNTIVIKKVQEKVNPLIEGKMKHAVKDNLLPMAPPPPPGKPVKSIAREMVRKVFLNLNSEQFNEIKMSEEYGINKGKAIDNWFDKNY